MPDLRVRFYGRLAEEIRPELIVREPPADLTVGALRSSLADQFGNPKLTDPGIKVVIGEAIVPDDRMVYPADEVEFLAIVSGG